MRTSILLACAGLVLSFPGPAAVQQPSKAQAAFDEGRRLEEAGDFKAAAAQFEESERLEPTAGTALNLGSCYERLGRLASAATAFRRGAERADAAGETKRATRAREKAAEMERRASTLVLVVSPVEGLEVLLDGAHIDVAAWTTRRPIDGGHHRVVARAPERREWSIDVSIANEGENAKVDIPELPPARATVPPPVVTPESRPMVGWVVTGIGVLGLGVGTVFGVRALKKTSDYKDACPNGGCLDEHGLELHDQAKSAATISTVAIASGAAVTIAGVIVLLRTGERGHASVAPMASTNSVGLSFSTAF